eukprot:6176905-Pleurochrysis_carterae.AAC.2
MISVIARHFWVSSSIAAAGHVLINTGYAYRPAPVALAACTLKPYLAALLSLRLRAAVRRALVC